ncbi:hypothetical protein MP228_005955 [Amoeboaphelidium protococcarum]|nr:hypothetical protein MP228_005955 [Amoeboaphelidium protococcarum]
MSKMLNVAKHKQQEFKDRYSRNSSPVVNPHLELEDRDPHYDYDHAIAHGTSSKIIQRHRTMSIEFMNSFDLPATHAAKVVADQEGSDAEFSSDTEMQMALNSHVSVDSNFTSHSANGVKQKAAAAHKPLKIPPAIIEESEKHRIRRRHSHDEKTSVPLQLFIPVEKTQQRILAQEDTDGDFQITITDKGPKILPLGTLASMGHRKHEVRGTYALANLLQELALAADHGRSHIVIEESRLLENPVDRLSRMIKHHFWDGLTRRIDSDGLEMICLDPKNRHGNHRPRIYVPYDDPEALQYYNRVAFEKPHLNLDVIQLPKNVTPDYVKSINGMPGILALALKKTQDESGAETIRGCPFVVPGGRFNEMYGWDSYFAMLGLLVDGRISLSRAMVDNFVYSIKHYGKILNANRSYYLTRSQPPFLTDMALKVYECLPKDDAESNKKWLAEVFRAAIKEYNNVWMSSPRYVESIGLSRFHGEGKGMPPETEASHFDAVLKPFADKYGLDIPAFSEKYNDGSIVEPELDEYFIHDRAVRESGHDTTYRLEGKCASICPVDLNALLYKYEIDIATVIRDVFGDNFTNYDGGVEKSEDWFRKATHRKAIIDKYLWNEEEGMYFDYDIKQNAQNPYESVTTFFPLWAGCASKHQTDRVVIRAIQLFEVQGGLVSGTEKSRGTIGLSRPNRQWDFPFGWAPHQAIAWKGLQMYGYEEVARRFAYRWLFTITKAFVDFNGVVPEKFDIVSLNHKVNVEYGNVGIDFKFIPREGFGWMNSSFKVGLQLLSNRERRALGALVHPDKIFTIPKTTSTSGLTGRQSV